MNKKVNTALFILGATVFNIVVTVGSFLVLLLIYGRLLAPFLPETAVAWGLPVVFVAAIGVSFVAYRFAVKALLEKVGADAFFGTFNSRRKGID